jgi:DNA-binding CsgD family transcriptional regulator
MSAAADAAGLIDRLYEAAVVPELWPDVIDALSRRTDAALGSLMLWKDGVSRWVGTPAADKLISDYVALGRPDFNSRVPRATESALGFITEHEMFKPEEIGRDPFYREFLYPRGYGWVAVTSYTSPSGECLYFSLERHLSRGPFEKQFVHDLNRLRPHLGRAALMAARLDLQRAQASAWALQAIGLPAAVLRRGGCLYAANPLFEALMPDVLREGSDRLAFIHAAADRLLARALGCIDCADSQPAVQSIPLPATEQRVAMIAHVLPVRGAAHDIFAQSHSIMVITPVDRRAVPTAQVLQGLFDLTPAEARIARGVAEGLTLEALADSSGLSLGTVRIQLKAVMAKTGVHRQAELAALLAGATLQNS